MGVNTCDITEEGRALIAAVKAEDEAATRDLLANGADVHTRLSCSEPLFLNATRNKLTGIMAAFIEHGLNPDEFTDGADRTALQLSFLNHNRDAALMLLDAGADPNRPATDDGLTLLHYAAFDNDAEMCRKLLEKGADAAATTQNGEDVYAFAGPDASEAIRTFITARKTRRLHNLRQQNVLKPRAPSI